MPCRFSKSCHSAQSAAHGMSISPAASMIKARKPAVGTSPRRSPPAAPGPRRAHRGGAGHAPRHGRAGFVGDIRWHQSRRLPDQGRGAPGERQGVRSRFHKSIVACRAMAGVDGLVRITAERRRRGGQAVLLFLEGPATVRRLSSSSRRLTFGCSSGSAFQVAVRVPIGRSAREPCQRIGVRMSATRMQSCFAAWMLTLVVVFYALPAYNMYSWALIGISASLAVLAGVKAHRPSRRLPWYLLSAVLASFTLGDTTYNVPHRFSRRGQSFPEPGRRLLPADVSAARRGADDFHPRPFRRRQPGRAHRRPGPVGRSRPALLGLSYFPVRA